MLLVKVELHPFGDSSHAREIARLRIHNDGRGTALRGNYIGDVYKAGTQSGHHGKPIRHAEVHNYPRKSLHVWNLVARMLKQLEYK